MRPARARAPCAHHFMVRAWCAVRGEFRRVEAAERAFDHIDAQHFSKRCTVVRSSARFAVSA
eukprot:2697084-Lingulodinium_polyedra.AAC.1